jgi:hypothetical protein
VKPLGRKQRTVILAAELYRREHDCGPPWGALRRALGVDRVVIARLLDGLRVRGLVTYTEKPGSLQATELGVRAALQSSERSLR